MKVFKNILNLFVLILISITVVSCSSNKSEHEETNQNLMTEDTDSTSKKIAEEDSISKFIYSLFYDSKQINEVYDDGTPAYNPHLKSQFERYQIVKELPGIEKEDYRKYFTESFIKSYRYPLDEIWGGSDHTAVDMDIYLDSLLINDNSTATVNVKWSENGPSQKYELIKENDNWKINSIN